MIKRCLLAAAGILCAAVLSACGGGGGGSTPAPPQTRYVNTASAFYLPLKAGNTWTFNTGGKMTDTGTTTLTCACSLNNVAAEAIALVSPAGVQSGVFYFIKATSAQTGGVLTELAGTSTGTTGTILLVIDGSGNGGIPIMDDRAVVNETWNYAGAITSTITAVGGTQQYSGPYVLIRNVNADTFSGQLSLTWSFAQGVGPTALTYGGQSATLTAFSIDAVASQARARRTQAVDTTRVQTADHGLALLKALF